MAKSKSNDKWFTVFTTAWGPMGVVASEAGITRVALPHYAMKDLKELLAWEHQGATESEAPFVAFIEQCRAFFQGELPDFSAVPVALPSPGAFFGKVYRACMAIPYGSTRSYKELSMTLGSADGARAVATALSKNPTPLIVPCHRVIYSHGGAGGFSAEGGVAVKTKLLELEKRGPR